MQYIPTDLPQYWKLKQRSQFSDAVIQSGHVLIFSQDGQSLTAKLPDGSYVTIGSNSASFDFSLTTLLQSDALAGKNFYNSNGVLVSGTIQTVTASLNEDTVTVPKGYIASQQTLTVQQGGAITTTENVVKVPKGWRSSSDSVVVQQGGSAVVTDNVVHIPKGYRAASDSVVVGTLQDSQSYTPGTSNQVIPAGTYLAGDQTILGDANLVGSNILSGVSIFGVPGELEITGGAAVTLGYISSGEFQPVAFSGTSSYDSGQAESLSCYKFNVPGVSDSQSETPVESWTSSGAVFTASGARPTVMSGQRWISTTIGPFVYVSNLGGYLEDTQLWGGGSLYVSSGGIASNILVGGGQLNISSGAVADSITNGSGTVQILSGGTATNIVQFSSRVDVGGELSGAVIYRGNLYVSGQAYNISGESCGINVSSGYISGAAVSSGGILQISKGGIMQDITLAKNGILRTFSGGTGSDVIVLSGGSVQVNGGMTIDVTLSSGGSMGVDNYGIASDTTVSWGGYLKVYSRGSANSIILSSGGTMEIWSQSYIADLTSMTGAVVISH